MAVRRSPWLIFNNPIPPKLKPTDPASTRTKLAELLFPAAPFLIMNRWLSSKVNLSDSGVTNQGGKDKSHLAVTGFLKSYELSEIEIDEIIKRCPKILSYGVSNNLNPKLNYLVECGFNGSALRSLVVSDPFILDMSLHKHIMPRYQFLKAYLMEKVNPLIMRYPWVLRRSTLEFGVEYLKKQGVPVGCITKLLAQAPYTLVSSANRLAKLVEATKAVGIKPADAMFVWYIKMFASMSETSWKKKVEVLKSLGWSDQDVRATLLHYSQTFVLSEEKLRSVMDFYVNNVKAEPRDVIGQPTLLGLSLNRRIIPRYEVMRLLKEHNLLKSQKITTFFLVPEKKFIRSYIEKNLEQVPHLLQVYCDSRKAKEDTEAAFLSNANAAKL